MTKTNLNSSREDYIQAIYRLTKDQPYTSNKAISDFFGISRPSVTEMIKKLDADGLLSLDGLKISLSDQGRRLAQKFLSTHRLWEYFLEKELNLPASLAHDQADLLEHATGEDLLIALNAYLGYPKESPKGKIIYLNIQE